MNTAHRNDVDEPNVCSDLVDQRRRHERRRADWPAACSDASGATWDARVVDTSNGGLGLENCPPLAVDQTIVVALENVGTFACRVAWSNGSRCGIEFLPDNRQIKEAAEAIRLLGLFALGHWLDTNFWSQAATPAGHAGGDALSWDKPTLSHDERDLLCAFAMVVDAEQRRSITALVRSMGQAADHYRIGLSESNGRVR